jgi:hypothetical protein
VYVRFVTVPPTVNVQLGSAFVLPTVPAKDADVTVTLGATKFSKGLLLLPTSEPDAFVTVKVPL